MIGTISIISKWYESWKQSFIDESQTIMNSSGFLLK